MATTYQVGIPAQLPGEQYSGWVQVKLTKLSSKEINMKTGPHLARFDFVSQCWMLRYFRGGRKALYIGEVEGWKVAPKNKPRPKPTLPN
ncbi:hypothetical protein Q0590_25360 [Rhodocytophaga aerolata]|uniref:Uncharacterized protein n=1 Tax=Rhodocytophaga aerolata TaxID=455078 RepID=A0ABT8RC03_9BACT|nr:hypothetical protein [Rhodocytophaga aerolata]MDO1449631.1 hypothetical protein [Rhodocytophaga aerolata]